MPNVGGIDKGSGGVTHARQIRLQGTGQNLLLVGAHFLSEATDLALAEMDALLVWLRIFRSITVDHLLYVRI